MKRFSKAVAVSASALAMAAAAVLPAGPVNAAPAAAAAVDICHHATLGGSYICDYGVATGTLADGRKQVFVVGTDYAVYSRWQLGGGTWSATWYDMGGDVRSPVAVTHQSTNHLRIDVTGTNGARYYRHRNASTEARSEWALA